jgi:hypothetical protein
LAFARLTVLLALVVLALARLTGLATDFAVFRLAGVLVGLRAFVDLVVGLVSLTTLPAVVALSALAALADFATLAAMAAFAAFAALTTLVALLGAALAPTLRAAVAFTGFFAARFETFARLARRAVFGRLAEGDLLAVAAFAATGLRDLTAVLVAARLTAERLLAVALRRGVARFAVLAFDAVVRTGRLGFLAVAGLAFASVLAAGLAVRTGFRAVGLAGFFVDLAAATTLVGCAGFVAVGADFAGATRRFAVWRALWERAGRTALVRPEAPALALDCNAFGISSPLQVMWWGGLLNEMSLSLVKEQS